MIICRTGGDELKSFQNLMCVKSVITILLISSLVVLSFKYPVEYAETLKSSVTMVVTFYFAHQTDKQRKEDEHGKTK